MLDCCAFCQLPHNSSLPTLSLLIRKLAVFPAAQSARLQRRMGRTIAHNLSFLGRGRTTPGKVGTRSETTLLVLGPPVLSKVGIMDLRTNHYRIMRYHSCPDSPCSCMVSFSSQILLSDYNFFSSRSCLGLACGIYCCSFYSYIVSFKVFVILILYYEYCGNRVVLAGPNRFTI